MTPPNDAIIPILNFSFFTRRSISFSKSIHDVLYINVLLNIYSRVRVVVKKHVLKKKREKWERKLTLFWTERIRYKCICFTNAKHFLEGGFAGLKNDAIEIVKFHQVVLKSPPSDAFKIYMRLCWLKVYFEIGLETTTLEFSHPAVYFVEVITSVKWFDSLWWIIVVLCRLKYL